MKINQTFTTTNPQNSARLQIQKAGADYVCDISKLPTLPSTLGSNISLNFQYTPVYTELPSHSGSVRIYTSSPCLLDFGNGQLLMPAGTEIFGTTATQVTISSIGYPGLINITGLNDTFRHTITSSSLLALDDGINMQELPTGNKIRLCALEDCYIGFAGAADTYFEAGTEYISVPSSATHIYGSKHTNITGLYITGAN